MIYRFYRWYDRLDKEHGAERFLLFMFLILWPALLIPFISKQHWLDVYAVNMGFWGLTRAYFMVRYDR